MGGPCSLAVYKISFVVLLAVSGNKAKVHFVDYGNFDEVPVSSLVAMTADFLELPVQAVHCRLAGI